MNTDENCSFDRVLLLFALRDRRFRQSEEGKATLARLQKLLLRLSDNWSSYRLFLGQGDVPATNNASERAIGRWRIRSRSTRGFKTWAGLANAFTLCNAHIV
jgi:hypothetical protein